jgi:beta-N-acetylhexosaminidase
MIYRRKLVLSALAALCARKVSAETPSHRPTQVGQLLISGFRGTNALDPDVETVRRYLENGSLGGVILLGRNIRSPEQLVKLTQILRTSSEIEPIICIDQEGGRAGRVGTHNGFLNWGSAADVAQSGRNNSEVLDYYVTRAQQLRDAGVNLNLGPVLDLNTNPFNPVIGMLGRSYGQTVEEVVHFGELFVRAHRSVGLMTCLKHFPGHGSSQADSHQRMADVTQTWSAKEIAPFEMLTKAGFADTLMNSHLVHADLSDKPNWPTSLSKRSVEEIRHGLGFAGPIIVDDLQMGAITNFHEAGDAAVAAVAAGNSLLIYANFKKKFRVEQIRTVETALSTALQNQVLSRISVLSALELTRSFRQKL